MARTSSPAYRRIPAVDRIVDSPEAAELASRSSRPFVTFLVRRVLDNLRRELAESPEKEWPAPELEKRILESLKQEFHSWACPSLKKVINATGVILHTNLGRAPVGDAARRQLEEVASNYSNLEFDLARGSRGKRDVIAGRLLETILDCPRAIQDRFQQASGDDVSLAPAAAGQVEFKVGVVGGDFLQLPAGGISHRRSSQVGVQNYASGVDDLLQAGAGPGVKLLLQGLQNAFLQFRGRPLLFGALRQLPAQVIQDPADQEGDEGAAGAAGEFRCLGTVDNPVHCRNPAVGRRRGSSHGRSRIPREV